AYWTDGDCKKAEPLYVKALDGFKKTLDPNDKNIRVTTDILALIYTELGNTDKAIEYYKILIDLQKEHLGPEAFDTLSSIKNLGLAYYTDGDYKKAESLYVKALDGFKKTLDPFDENIIHITSMVLNNYISLKKDEKVIKWSNILIDLQKNKYGDLADDTLDSIEFLAQKYMNLGDYKKAESVFVEALDKYKKKLEPFDEKILSITDSLALIYLVTENFEKAIEYYKILIEIQESKHGQLGHDTLLSINLLGNAYFKLGDVSQAKALYNQAAKGLEKTLGRDHPDTVQILNNLAKVEN
ncbi:tetratricopeptide repeat protein, partial [Alphaproteobacteria bacterium]|nr:tetratricopeptide repeat protein [Alphaproteobacteria bacterium]